jgi:ATP-dependent Lhr-like helicase
MKRTFRNAAIIAGLIERRMPGKEKTTRQMTVNTDLIYDVLRSHQPDHMCCCAPPGTMRRKA